MRTNRHVFWLLALAFAGLLVTTGPAHAFWWHSGPTYRQKTVIRGGWPGFIGPTTGLVGPGVAGREFAWTFGAPESAWTWGPTFVSPGSGTTGGGEFAREFAAEMKRQRESAREADIEAGARGGAVAKPPATTTTTSSDCDALKARLDQLDTKIGQLTKQLAGVETKVDRLFAERDKEQAQKDRAQAIAEITAIVDQTITARLKEQNQHYLPLFRALTPADEGKKATYEELLKALEKK
jgi:hypothetical protein